MVYYEAEFLFLIYFTTHVRLTRDLRVYCLGVLSGVRFCNLESDRQEFLFDPKDNVVGHPTGRLRDSLLNWLHPSRNGQSSKSPGLDSEKWLRRGLAIMMEEYLKWGKPNTESSLCKDDFRGWEETAQRWTRLVAIGVISNETQQYLVLVTAPKP